MYAGCHQNLLLSHTHTLQNSNAPDTHSPHFGGPHAAQQFPRKTAEVSYNLEEMWGLRTLQPHTHGCLVPKAGVWAALTPHIPSYFHLK